VVNGLHCNHVQGFFHTNEDFKPGLADSPKLTKLCSQYNEVVMHGDVVGLINHLPNFRNFLQMIYISLNDKLLYYLCNSLYFV